MKLVVGLGNPGPRYARTRHNAGFRVVERFAATREIDLSGWAFGGRFGRGRLDAPGRELEVGVLEPHTYMNRSGEAVAAALAGLPVGDPSSDLIVVLDDIDLPFGRLRLRPGGGAGGHRGLADVIDRLGRRDFARLRFGVGRPPEGGDAVEYVLEGFSPEEERALTELTLRAARALETSLASGVVAAMNRFNRDPEAEDSDG